MMHCNRPGLIPRMSIEFCCSAPYNNWRVNDYSHITERSIGYCWSVWNDKITMDGWRKANASKDVQNDVILSHKSAPGERESQKNVHELRIQKRDRAFAVCRYVKLQSSPHTQLQQTLDNLKKGALTKAPQCPVNYIATAPLRPKTTLKYAGKRKRCSYWSDHQTSGHCRPSVYSLTGFVMSRNLTMNCTVALGFQFSTRTYVDRHLYYVWAEFILSSNGLLQLHSLWSVSTEQTMT